MAPVQPGESDDFHPYVHGIAEARYTIRKVLGIVNDQAKNAGLDPLEHQALLQIYGSDQQMLAVSALAKRLGIPTALASRLATSLEKRGLAERMGSSRDRRVTEVHITQTGRDIVKEIDKQVRRHVDFFSDELTPSEKWSALRILAFYVGLDVEIDHIRDHMSESSA